MDNKSIYELQKIDCNCNNCIFMQRDMLKFKASLDIHNKWQWDYFNVLKQKLISKAKKHKDVYYDLERWDALLTEAYNMRFQFDKKEAKINYGICAKLLKDISFIPDILQLNTQECFKHRSENG